MNRVSQFVNNFLHHIVATAGLNFLYRRGCYHRASTAPLPFLPRRVSVSAKRGVILCTSRRSRKPFVKKFEKAPVRCRARGLGAPRA
ncbi:hypothetical protein DIE03_37595 [Burkholderia sp. Bp8992]|nr:hypothetical protein DIE03_37595 [Burkholderia sp. Bp8992]